MDVSKTPSIRFCSSGGAYWRTLNRPSLASRALGNCGLDSPLMWISTRVFRISQRSPASMPAMISSTFSGRPISTSAAAASARKLAGTFPPRSAASILSGPFCVPFQASIRSEVALSQAQTTHTNNPARTKVLMVTGC